MLCKVVHKNNTFWFFVHFSSFAYYRNTYKLRAYSQDLAFSKAQLNICLCELKEKPKWKQIKFKKNSLRIKKKQHNNYFIKFNFYLD